MKKKAWGMSVIAFIFGLILGCYADDSSPSTTGNVDYTSHNTDYSILIRNNTSERLVAFKGELKAETLIGSIPTKTKDHGLPKNPALFDKTEDFLLILLTEAQYNAYKSNLGLLRNTPFTQVYVSYKQGGSNSTLYEIAGCLGGSNGLVISNSSSVNVELRVNSVAGEILGFVPAATFNTIFNLQDGKYTIFPIFKRYNQFRDTVETVYPKEPDSDNAWFKEITVSGGETCNWNLEDLLQSTTFTSGVAWVYIENQTSGEISFLNGLVYVMTASGRHEISSGESTTFQVDMPKTADGKYADSVVVSNWKFGPFGFGVALQTSETDAAPVTSLIIERDKMYVVTVTGNHSDNTLKAYVSKIIDIDTW